MTAAALKRNGISHADARSAQSGFVASLGASTLYAGSSWLTVTGFLMVADIGISLLGLLFDPTVITGAPAWLKPLKFAISTGIFSFTVAWMIGRLKRTRRYAGVLGRCMAVALTLEIVLIDLQAARHTTSHFNTATPFDGSVYAAMGIGIAVVFLATMLLLAAACLERFQDGALGWAIRLGLVLALAGMGVGSLMTLPTPQQLALARAAGGLPVRVGAHTVGAPDGGPSMPVTGWSADHGDLRIAHFLGLHGIQVLLATWWLAGRKRPTRWIVLAAVTSALAFGIVLVQALHGEPLLRPDDAILVSWGAWLVLSAFSAALLFFTQRNPIQEQAA